MKPDAHLYDLLALALVLLALGAPVPFKELLDFLNDNGKDAAILFAFSLFLKQAGK